MPIAETAAVASIISKLLSMSTDLLERKESREVASEVRDIQKLTIELHSLYTKIETKHHEIESSLRDKLFELQSANIKLEKAHSDIAREKDEILKNFDEWDQYTRKVSKSKFVYFAHKTEMNVYACASCKGKIPYPIILQPHSANHMFHECPQCETFGQVSIGT